MGTDESRLAMLMRHVREGAHQVARQRALIARLRMNGLPTDEAESLLYLFEDSQRLHEAHLNRVARNSAPGVAPSRRHAPSISRAYSASAVP